MLFPFILIKFPVHFYAHRLILALSIHTTQQISLVLRYKMANKQELNISDSLQHVIIVSKI